MKVRIIWNGSGGQLDAVTVSADDERGVADALMEMIDACGVVHPGDSFTIEDAE
jgi:hypothetical protein